MSLNKNQIVSELDDLGNELLPMVIVVFLWFMLFLVTMIVCITEILRLPLGDHKVFLWAILSILFLLMSKKQTPPKHKTERYRYLVKQLKQFD